MANTSTTGYGLRAIETVGNTPATQGQSKYPLVSGLGIRILKNEPVGPQHTDGDDGYFQSLEYLITTFIQAIHFLAASGLAGVRKSFVCPRNFIFHLPIHPRLIY